MLVAYSVIELVVVVVAVLIAIVYRPDRPYRANYLLLSGGIVIVSASDRVVAYLRTIGVDGADLWGAFGFTLGPLMIAFAVLQLPAPSATGRGRDVMDLVQLGLPYLGFLGISVLFTFNLLIGRELNTISLSAAIVAGLSRRRSAGGRDAGAAAADRAAVRGRSAASPTRCTTTL